MIASRLLKAMSDKGFNQKQLAEATGLTRAAVCRYLQGSRTAREDALIAISKALNVSIDWLLGAEKAEPKRGRWEIIYYDNEPKFAYCSECDQKLIFTKGFEQTPNFCPKCGADMRERKKDGQLV